jgi:hypothetical protein
VILGSGQQHHALAIAEGEYGHFGTNGALLQHQGDACQFGASILGPCAEAAGKNFLDGGACFLNAFGHRDAFAGGQAICLHHKGAPLGRQDLQSLFAAVCSPVAGGGNAGLLHQRLSPLLTCLQLRPIGPRAEAGESRGAQAVRQAGSQGGFWTHHHQFNC